MRKEISRVFLVFKMKILFVNYSIGGYAGDSLSMITIVKGLIEKGHEVMIATTDGDGYFYDKTPYANVAEDINLVAKAIKLRQKGETINFKSPPFYGNMMSLIYCGNRL